MYQYQDIIILVWSARIDEVIKMKTIFKIVMAVVLSLALCCVAVFAISKSVDLERLIVGVFKKESAKQDTEKYKDYVCESPNLMFYKSKVYDLNEYFCPYLLREDDNFKFSFHYYRIDGYSKENLIGAAASVHRFMGGEVAYLILSNPAQEFSPWDEWTISGIKIYHQNSGNTKVLKESRDLTVISNFIEFVSELEKSFLEKYSESDSDISINYSLTTDSDLESDSSTEKSLKSILSSKSYTIDAFFEETDEVVWRSLVRINHYDDGDVVLEIAIKYFEYYPEIECYYFEIPRDTPIYDFVWDAIGTNN